MTEIHCTNHVDRKDRPAEIRAFVRDNPAASNCEIGRRFGVSEAAIRKHRKRAGNPEHQRLFSIPSPQTSASRELSVASILPEAEAVTGDRQVDAMLWLARVCKTATDLATLGKAVEAAKRIKADPEKLRDRYQQWLIKQGAGAFQTVFATMSLGDIDAKAEAARERIATNAEGIAIFGSFETAMEPTEAERMILETAGPMPPGYGYEWPAEAFAGIFARSVNPWTLSDVLAERAYFDWLYKTRKAMFATANPDDYMGDDDAPIEARRYWMMSLLTTIEPVDDAERTVVAQAAVAKGFSDFSKDTIAVLAHLCGAKVREGSSDFD
ncbi:conserved hypothetical protein [Thiocapsa sp. KS1]|nr:hypothetical protein [Thiocapsa sp. KS1]CRI63747.1 conserved hypothetical protein [Thiocapsa sp. KS1]